MALSLKSHWILAAATDHDSDKRSAARALPDNPLQSIWTEPEVEICEGENVSLSFNLTIPANLTPDRLYERTVWSPDRKNYCFIYGNMSKCHGKDFVQRAEISETWSSGEHGQLMFRLDNVSLGDAGYYEGELKTAYDIDNVNVMLTVKEASACLEKPEGGDTATGQEKPDDSGVWWEGYAAGIGTCLAAVNVTASDRIPTPGARRDNRLQFINAEVEVCEGENASFILHVAIPANLTADQVYERTVWSPDRKNFCDISGNTSACYGKDFVQRATISDTWFPVQPGERTKHGQLKFQLNNVSLADAGRYGPELKTDFRLNSVNVMLTVKDASACQQKPQDGDTGEKTDPETYWRRGFEGGFGAGFGACLGLVIMGGLAAAIWRYRTKDEK
ncbi:hypothetical protein Bbelb_379180 [Branchiostoma belcheri]|nr:hypothetical protein Bbelb_379180 [Branchiostoma belcheri]